MTTDLQKTVLLAEADLSEAEAYVSLFQRRNLNLRIFRSSRELAGYLEAGLPGDALILDPALHEPDTLSFSGPVIVVTSRGSVNAAVEYMKNGASDFLVRPFGREKLLSAVEKVLSCDTVIPAALAGLPRGFQHQGHRPGWRQGGTQSRQRRFGEFIGTSAAMQNIYGMIENASRSQATVFITGESGTGKEICAEAIHRLGGRADRPFVPVNCAAIPRELLESELFGHVKGAFTGAIADREGAARLADGGTLFFDEIAEMDLNMQTKLLRFLQNLSYQPIGSGRVFKTDVRIICATNRDPLTEIRQGRFREDLYYRLHVVPIAMPPLRERGDDILDIAEAALIDYAAEEGKAFRRFSSEVEEAISLYSWPGNIRELQNVIRHIVVMHDAPVVGLHMLPPAFCQSGRLRRPAPGAAGILRPLWEIEREAIERAIEACGGNIPRAAAILEISPSTIYRKKMAWDDLEDKTGGAGGR